MAVPEYIKQNKQNIKPQGAFPIKGYFKSDKNDYVSQFGILTVLNDFFEKEGYEISRKDFKEIYKNKDKRLFVISIMIWGGIRKDHYKKFLNDIKKRTSDDLNDWLEKSYDLIKQANLESYTKLITLWSKGGDFKLSGVGISFFTKIFYFLAKEKGETNLIPLIFDKWTKNAYYALLLDLNPNCKRLKLFKAPKKGEGNKPGIVDARGGKYEIQAYFNYVTDFNQWSKDAGIKNPDHLEEFVFGVAKKYDDPTNPRVELWKIIKEHRNLD